MFLLALPAFAHIPHDTVEYFAAPADLNGDQLWWVGRFHQAVQTLDYSENEALSWRKSTGTPASYALDAMAYLEDGTIVMTSGFRYFYSSDEGVTWASIVSPGKPADISGADRLWLATPSGLYEATDLADTATLSLEGDIVRVEASGSEAAAVDADGAHFVYAEGAWTQSVLPEGVAAVATTADGTYIGTASGDVYGNDAGTWAACGALPGAGDDHSDILHFATTGALVVAVTGLGGPYVSGDSCASWFDRTVPQAPAYGPAGSVRTTPEAYTGLIVSGSEFLVGGWAGLYRSTNAGVLWKESQWLLAATGPMGPGEPAAAGGQVLPGDPSGNPEEAPTGNGVDAIEVAEEGEAPTGGCGGAAYALFLLPLGIRRRR